MIASTSLCIGASPLMPARQRNALATRSAILACARDRFADESYDDVSLRDIAGAVGVDAALVSRYFGSKEDLFLAALESCGDGRELTSGPQEDFGSRIADDILLKPQRADKLKGMSIVLRSIGSTRASEIVRSSCTRRFLDPLAEWLGGSDAAVRARLLAGVIMGMSISRDISPAGFDLSPEDSDIMRDRLAKMLQYAVDG